MAVPSFLPVFFPGCDRQPYHYQNQIRCLSKYLNVPLRKCYFIIKKRVLPFASREMTASVTAEAAFCFPLFLFFFWSLLQPVFWLDRQRKVQTAAELCSEQLCQYAYLAERGAEEAPEGETQEKGETLEKIQEKEGIFGDGNLLEGFSKGAAVLWMQGEAGKYAEGLTVRKAEFLDPEGNISFLLEYREPIPFFPILSQGVTIKTAVKKRAWIGIEGKVGRTERDDALGMEDADEQMVYVGSGMGRYHLSRDCHYLSNQYQTMTESQAETERNASGRKRTPCASCKDKRQEGGMVYATPEGRHYHYSKSCSAMISYVRRVPLSEVAYLGACSYCGYGGSTGGLEK